MCKNKFLGIIIKDFLEVSYNPCENKIVKNHCYSPQNKACPKQEIMIYALLFLYPYMTYCLEIWRNAYKTNVLPIFKLQKRAIRIMNQ